ncbi:MAG: glycosyltransferase family 1 protein [Bacteroidetes bacterium]|nr:MAG: glycosyltransferase family 1 protein [Bacteroidota bacterium]
MLFSQDYRHMRIAVNTRMLQNNKMEGIGYFTYETFRRITRDHPEHEFIFIFDRPFSQDFIFSSNVKGVFSGPRAGHPFLWFIWYEWIIPAILKKEKADMFVSCDGFVSLRSNVKSVAVIHDINFEHYPGDLPFLIRKYLRFFFPKFAKRANRIATVSDFSRKDLAEHYQINPEKIDLTYNGVGDSYKPLSEEEKKEMKDKYAGGNDYFLFVGALHARKNISRLLTAFDIFKKHTGSSMKLILAGTRRWWTAEMEQAFSSMHFKGEVVFTGRLEDSELRKLTGAAFAMTYVSVFEGFGIPILEAFRSKVPLITSHTSAMPEIGGDAAYYVNPFSEENIAAAMEKLSNESVLRDELSNKGLSRSLSFNWDQTAASLWSCICKASGIN